MFELFLQIFALDFGGGKSVKKRAEKAGKSS